MQQGRRALLGMGLLGMTQPLWAGTPREQAAALATLDSELAAVVREPACELASLSVLAIRAGRVVYERQFGQRQLGDPGLPANRDTLYRIASISKMVTTLGLMRLVEAGKAELDADVSGYLGFPLRNPHFPQRAITLRHLLSHTSSLRDDGGYSWGADTALKEVLVPGSRLYGQGAMWAANAGPGEFFTYCNLAWGVIGTIMEAVSGERFDQLMQRLLFQPLGVDAGYNPSALPPAALANLATLYRKRTTDTEIWDRNGPWIAQVDDYRSRPAAPPAGIERYVVGANATPFSPTGGLRISAHGLGVIMRLLMAGGVHAGQRLLRTDTLAAMLARQWTYNGRNGDTLDGLYHAWGLGNQQWDDDPAAGSRLVDGGGFAGIGHFGEAYGLISVFAADLNKGNGMVLLAGGTSTDPLAYKGRYSAMSRFEEQILSALWQRAIGGRVA